MTRRWSSLVVVAATFVVVDILHFADHVRQGRALGPGVTTPGTISLILAVAVLVFAIRHARVAPALATALGAVVSVGVLAVHLLPPYGAFSDSYLPLHLDALSYVSLAVLSLSAAALAITGARALTTRTSVVSAVSS